MGNRYREHDVNTATPTSLVSRLFEAALRHIRTAREATEAAALPERCRALAKAHAIVGELRASLDLTEGGEVAERLDSLYDFAIERLGAATVERSAEPLDEALRVLEPLADAWRQLSSGGLGGTERAA